MFEEFTSITEEQAKEFMKGSESQRVRDYIRNNIVLVEPVTSCSVLDVGCGRGIDASRYKGLGYWGIDVSEELISRAKEDNQQTSYTFEVCDAQNMPFTDKSFDNVICKSFMEHLPSEEVAEKVFSEMARVAWKRIIIAWHTPPSMHLSKSEINVVKGHFGKDVYQNRYAFRFFKEMIPKYVQGNMRVDIIDNFEVWIIDKEKEDKIHGVK